jgi:hypothetical protein
VVKVISMAKFVTASPVYFQDSGHVDGCRDYSHPPPCLTKRDNILSIKKSNIYPDSGPGARNLSPTQFCSLNFLDVRAIRGIVNFASNHIHQFNQVLT